MSDIITMTPHEHEHDRSLEIAGPTSSFFLDPIQAKMFARRILQWVNRGKFCDRSCSPSIPCASCAE